jgi:2-polyprenyl-3-methyl-5-hydroxy-6-metoxy-1,4-benzoquinol methylase
MDEYSGAHLESLKLIGRSKKVLDVGCSDGYLLQAIRDKLKGIVDGIEINPETARRASKYARKVYVGSVEDSNVLNQLHETYDVLLFMDVLEHCKDPWSVLEKTKPVLADDGYVIASVPNVANWRVRLGILMGNFDYQQSGLLDKGHLRFFTIRSVKALFEQAGYEIVKFDFTLGGLPETLSKISKPGKNILKAVIKNIVRFFPGLFANQFIVKAVKRA